MPTDPKQIEGHGRDIEVVERSDEPNVFAVEIVDYENEGAVFITTFYGPQSRERANEYAEWQRTQ
jgi:hypothetical protein